MFRASFLHRGPLAVFSINRLPSDLCRQPRSTSTLDLPLGHFIYLLSIKSMQLTVPRLSNRIRITLYVTSEMLNRRRIAFVICALQKHDSDSVCTCPFILKPLSSVSLLLITVDVRGVEKSVCDCISYD